MRLFKGETALTMTFHLIAPISTTRLDSAHIAPLFDKEGLGDSSPDNDVPPDSPHLNHPPRQRTHSSPL